MQEEIKKSLEILKQGGIILYPSDTIWGIGCDATNTDAIKRIYALKKRSISKSMLVLLDSPSKLSNYVENIPKIAFFLIAIFDNKPLTIIFSNVKNVAPNLIASDGTLGIRITKESFSKSLCSQLKKPLVSTSANISGEPSPTNYSEINHKIIRSVDYIVNYGKNEIRQTKPSKIFQVKNGELVKIIRE